ncbi:MAG: DUF3820 family protein [Arenicella sp.]|nr:DUF3820 family protein [Arenicella sp.]
MSKAQLIKLVGWQMPFGKYKGRLLIDLPEAYLLWFAKRGFPQGELGQLLSLCLQLKIDGSDGLLKPLRQNSGESL